MNDNLSDNKKSGLALIFDDISSESVHPVFSAFSKPASPALGDHDFASQEGKLAIDILQTDDSIIVLSTMAGTIADSIEVYIHNDLLTIRGERRMPPAAKKDSIKYLHKECFWGKFSRSVVLPTEVKGDSASAEYKNGILKIEIPKKKTDARVHVTIVDE